MVGLILEYMWLFMNETCHLKENWQRIVGLYLKENCYRTKMFFWKKIVWLIWNKNNIQKKIIIESINLTWNKNAFGRKYCHRVDELCFEMFF